MYTYWMIASSCPFTTWVLSCPWHGDIYLAQKIGETCTTATFMVTSKLNHGALTHPCLRYV